MTPLVRLLIDHGLLQFGSFESDDGEQPFLLDLAMLPSYPAVFAFITDAIVARLPAVQPDYLLATADAVPLVAGVSLKTGIPLIYSRGTNQPPVTDLVGAYDIGHPAVMITSVLGDTAAAAHFIVGARRVGIEVADLIAVVDLGIGSLVVERLHSSALVRLDDVLDELVKDDFLSERHRAVVDRWLQK